MVENLPVGLEADVLDRWYPTEKNIVRIQVTAFFKDSIYDSRAIFLALNQRVSHYLADKNIVHYSTYPRPIGGGFGLDVLVNFVVAHKDQILMMLKFLPLVLSASRRLYKSYRVRSENAAARKWFGIKPKIMVDLTVECSGDEGYVDIQKPFEHLLLHYPELTNKIKQDFPDFQIYWSAQSVSDVHNTKLSIGFDDQPPTQKQVSQVVDILDKYELISHTNYIFTFRGSLRKKPHLEVSSRAIARG